MRSSCVEARARGRGARRRPPSRCAMRLSALLLALFACSANALVLRAPLRAGAVAPAAAGRAPSVAMRDVVRVEIELEQGEPYAAPRPLDASPRLRRPCCARSGASRPAAQFSAPPAAPAAPAAHPHPHRSQDGEGSPAVPQGRQHVGPPPRPPQPQAVRVEPRQTDPQGQGVGDAPRARSARTAHELGEALAAENLILVTTYSVLRPTDECYSHWARARPRLPRAGSLPPPSIGPLSWARRRHRRRRRRAPFSASPSRRGRSAA